ncbi:DUF2278 family protein [Chitinilyticum litopenaei]|uniref:DUF2278 family protein n=1 Tax=Chitinilyticum litopenaei TaxID=1121276 RepID=UPI000403626C|nr:DUF2278 family protein [Chitinilyticum litopenaei]
MPFPASKTYGTLSIQVTDVEGTHTSSFSGLSHFNLLGSDGSRSYQVNIDSQSSANPNVLMTSNTVSASDMQQILAAAGNPPAGFTALATQAGSGALDLIRQAQFAPVIAAFQSGTPLSADQIGAQLAQALTVGASLVVFGTYYDDSTQDQSEPRWHSYGRQRAQENSQLPPRGMDDVHLNQGTPSSQEQSADNGTYQDGALFVLNADGSATAFYFMFAGQCLQTDDSGNCSNGCANG